MRFLPVIIIVVIRCLLSINTDIDVLTFYMAESILIPILLVLSASSLRQGSRNLGFIGIPIGFGAYFGAIYLTFSLPPAVLLEYPVQVAIAFLLMVGSSLILFSTVSMGLWISKSVLTNYRLQARIAGLFIAVAIIIIWLFDVFTFLGLLGVYPLGLQGTELYYYIFLILAGIIFIPRRQGVTVFYFFLGLTLAIWGLFMINGGGISAMITGHYLRVIGTMIYVLFAGSFGGSALYLQHHPEHKLYIALPLWFFAEVLTSSLIQYPLTAPRVLLVGFALYVIVKEAKFKDDIGSSIISLICTVGGTIVAIFGMHQLGLFWLFVYFGGTPPLLDPISAIVLSSVGLIFCMYGFVTFGAFLRKKIAINPTNRLVLTIIGGLMVIVGPALGLTSFLILWPPLYITDTVFILLVGFGSMLVSIEPRRITGIGASLGFAMAISAIFSTYFYTVVIFIYPAMAAMIFFGIQHYRTDRKPKRQIRLPSTRRRVQPPTPPEIIASDEPAPSFEPPRQVRPEIRPVMDPIETPPITQEQDEERMARNWYNRAVTFREEGVIDEAIRSVETALKWVPDHKKSLALWKELQDEKKRRQFEN